MKTIEISGKVTFSFRQRRTVPDDEVAEIMESQSTLICNVDMDEVVCDADDVEWSDVGARVLVRNGAAECRRDDIAP